MSISGKNAIFLADANTNSDTNASDDAQQPTPSSASPSSPSSSHPLIAPSASDRHPLLPSASRSLPSSSSSAATRSFSLIHEREWLESSTERRNAYLKSLGGARLDCVAAKSLGLAGNYGLMAGVAAALGVGRAMRARWSRTQRGGLLLAAAFIGIAYDQLRLASECASELPYPQNYLKQDRVAAFRSTGTIASSSSSSSPSSSSSSASTELPTVK